MRSAALAAALGVALGAFVAPGPGTSALLADEIDDTVANLQVLAKAEDDTRLVQAVTATARTKEKRIDDALLAIVRTCRHDAGVKAAMKVLAAHKDPAFVTWARSKVNDERMLENRGSVYLAMLESLPAAAEAVKPAIPVLVNCADDRMKFRPDVATRAIKAIGGCPDKAAVEALILLLGKAEESEGGGGGGGGGSKPAPTPGRVSGGGTDTRGNVQQAKDACIDALKALTGAQDGGSTALSWKFWWHQNGKTFRFPEPEPDWPNLAEFQDALTGVVVRKPEPKGWVYEKSVYSGGRARVRPDVQGEMSACLDVMTYPKGAFADAAAYAQFLDEEWRKREFAEFAEGGEPAVAKRKIGGREFVVIAAKGLAAGQLKEWYSCERRVYVTLGAPDTFLALEGIVRETCPEAQRSALWAAMEGVTFKPPK